MMRNLRAALKFAALLLWSAALLPGALVSHLRARGRLRRGSWWTRLWGRGAWRLLGGRVEVAGESLPQGGGLVISNHLSYLDILVHAALFGARFAPKIEMKRWPLVGMMTAVCNPVWIDRRHRGRAGEAMREMCDAFAGEVPLLVYPEGTNGDGGELLPFRSTCFAAALVSGTPIRPVLTRYLPAADGTPLPWVGQTGFLPHFWRVLGLKEVVCQVYIMPEVRPDRCGRKELTARLRDMMAEHYRRWNENA